MGFDHNTVLGVFASDSLRGHLGEDLVRVEPFNPIRFCIVWITWRYGADTAHTAISWTVPWLIWVGASAWSRASARSRAFAWIRAFARVRSSAWFAWTAWLRWFWTVWSFWWLWPFATLAWSRWFEALIAAIWFLRSRASWIFILGFKRVWVTWLIYFLSQWGSLILFWVFIWPLRLLFIFNLSMSASLGITVSFNLSWSVSFTMVWWFRRFFVFSTIKWSLKFLLSILLGSLVFSSESFRAVLISFSAMLSDLDEAFQNFLWVWPYMLGRMINLWIRVSTATLITPGTLLILSVILWRCIRLLSVLNWGTVVRWYFIFVWAFKAWWIRFFRTFLIVSMWVFAFVFIWFFWDTYCNIFTLSFVIISSLDIVLHRSLSFIFVLISVNIFDLGLSQTCWKLLFHWACSHIIKCRNSKEK